ncbi:MAG: YggT family protein [Actinomycetota bacterium]|nr:YggT family protein [Actinomycetota bacterium]
MILPALSRVDVANYVSALFEVYILLILLYILLNLLFSFGMRPAYSRALDAVLGFLRDLCEPYLRIFRRFIPPLGMIDITPMVAIIVLVVVRTIVVSLISG